MMVFASILLVFSTFADEDLLSLLSDEPTKEEVQVESSHLVDALRIEIAKTNGGRVEAEQNIFLMHFKSKDYDKALFQWNSAFQQHEFAKSPSGIALYSLLLLENKMPINAVEQLFSVSESEQIHPRLVSIWKSKLNSKNHLWQFVEVDWNDGWTQVWGPSIAATVLSYQKADIETIAKILKSATDDKNARARLFWQIALQLHKKGETSKAAKFLVKLMKLEQTAISKDLLNLTVARMLYARGHLTASLQYYEKIQKASVYWFVAQEESAWSYLRKGEPQNTLAVTKTLLFKEFQPLVGPESVFLRSLSELKVCDYSSVGKSIEYFKWRFKKRASQLQSLVNGEQAETVEKLFALLKADTTDLSSLNSKIDFLPRYTSRDRSLHRLVKIDERLAGEAKTAEKLYSLSLTGGSSQVGFQAWIEQIKTGAFRRSESASRAAKSRLVQNAKEELAEISQILQKMHIVEAEAIQQASVITQVVAADDRKQIDSKSGTTGSTGKYDLKFQYDGEIWFDEIANYKIDLKKSCQAKKGGASAM